MIIILRLCFLALLFLGGCQLSTNANDADNLNRDPNPRDLNSVLSLKEHSINGKQVSFNLYFLDNGRAMSHGEWLAAMTNGDFATNAMRGFAQAINDEHLDKCGFGLSADPSVTPFYWHVSGEQATSCQSAIKPGQGYDVNHNFKTILQSKTGANNIRTTTHSMVFDSASKSSSEKRLVVPNGAYVTIYDFAKSGKAEELADFFALASDEVDKLTKANKDFTYEVHTGSNYAQSVPHFHLRIYEK